MINSLFIYMLCLSWEWKIGFVMICKTSRGISGSQVVQNMQIKKEMVVKFWLNWRSINMSCFLLAVNKFKRMSHHHTTDSTEGPPLTHIFRLGKTLLHEICSSGTVMGPLLIRKSPTCMCISQKLWYWTPC